MCSSNLPTLRATSCRLQSFKLRQRDLMVTTHAVILENKRMLTNLGPIGKSNIPNLCACCQFSIPKHFVFHWMRIEESHAAYLSRRPHEQPLLILMARKGVVSRTRVVPRRIDRIPLPIFNLDIIPHVGLSSRGERAFRISIYQYAGNALLVAQNLESASVSLADRPLGSGISRQS